MRCEVRNDVLGQQCVGCFAAAIEGHLTRTYGLTRESVALLRGDGPSKHCNPERMKTNFRVFHTCCSPNGTTPSAGWPSETCYTPGPPHDRTLRSWGGL